LKVFFAATDPASVYLELQSGLLFGSYCLIVYGANNSQRVLGLPANWNFIAGLVAASVNIVALLIMARLSDRVRRKPIYMFGLLLYVIVPFLFYWLLETKTLAAVILPTHWPGWPRPAPAVQSSFLAGLFPTEVRYTGISTSYQLSTVVIGIPSTICLCG
jgi:MFS family permease